MEVKGFYLISLVFVIIASLQCIFSFNLDNNLMNTLDFTRDALLSFKATQPDVIEKSGVTGPTGAKCERCGTSRIRLVRPGRPRPRPGTNTKITKPNLNKYLLAINQIEKAILEAGAMTQTTFTRNAVAKLKKIKDTIKAACENKQYVLARQLVGHAIYLTSLVSKRTRRQTGEGSSVLTDIQTLIGNIQFSKLLALDGGVTLAFAVDTTGSMGDEIKGSIEIATAIVNQPRTYLCDYILSPFNDPITAVGHGPVVYRAPEEKEIFINSDLKSLKALKGGDCDELAITGIQEIYPMSIMEFSPIYVFTDAGAKDASEENIDILLTSAMSLSTPINVFISKQSPSCISESAIEVYRDLALNTGGELLIFGTKFELEAMSDYINTALTGGSIIPVGGNKDTNAIITIGNGRRRRATSGRSEYTINIDDTVEKLTASVSTQRDTSDVLLINPSGKTVSGGKKLKRGAVFIVITPQIGQWKISISASGGKHSITCKGVSLENIDFSYEFLVSIKTRGKIKPLVSATPIEGRTATAIIAISGFEKVVPGSLKLEILGRSKEALGIKHALQPHGTAPGRFIVKYNVLQSIYYLVVQGYTKKGRLFERISPKPVRPQKIVIQTIMARNGYSITRGDSRGTTIILGVRNFGSTERFTVSVSDSKGYLASPAKKSIFIVKDRLSLLPLRFKAPSSAKKGSTYMVQVIVRGNSSKAKQSKALMMLVV